jgi:hypothetical protein
LGLLAAAVLLIVDADTHKLLPVFAIGVFIGFTISQTGLVRHWLHQRGRGWVAKATLNGTGAVLTAVALVVLFASKFSQGAWLLLLIVPSLMLLFDRIERYYRRVGEQMGLGKLPAKPVAGHPGDVIVIVPIFTISNIAALALQAAMRMPLTSSASCGNNGTPGSTSGSCQARTAASWHPRSISSEPKSRRSNSSSSCSSTWNRGGDGTESCTTNVAPCWPQHCVHAPTRSSPRCRYTWTEPASAPVNVASVGQRRETDTPTT